MSTLRHILILIFGTLIVWFTYSSKYGTTFFEGFIWMFLIGVWIFLSFRTPIKENGIYKTERQLKNFMFSYIMAAFSFTAIAVGIKTNHDFNKPTLVKAYYDGDINGVGIDLKDDGTYIFEDSAIGISHYAYGNYIIKGDTLTLNVENYLSGRFVLKEEDSQKYLSQIDSLGNEENPYSKFRIVVDNRK